MNNSHLVKKPSRVAGKKSVGFYYFKGKNKCVNSLLQIIKNGEERK